MPRAALGLWLGVKPSTMALRSRSAVTIGRSLKGLPIGLDGSGHYQSVRSVHVANAVDGLVGELDGDTGFPCDGIGDRVYNGILKQMSAIGKLIPGIYPGCVI